MPVIPMAIQASSTLPSTGVGIGILIAVVVLRFVKATLFAAPSDRARRVIHAVNVVALPLEVVLLGWVVALAASWL